MFVLLASWSAHADYDPGPCTLESWAPYRDGCVECFDPDCAVALGSDYEFLCLLADDTADTAPAKGELWCLEREPTSTTGGSGTPPTGTTPTGSTSGDGDPEPGTEPRASTDGECGCAAGSGATPLAMLAVSGIGGMLLRRPTRPA